MKKFNGYFVTILGDVIGKNFKIMCKETTGHDCNIISIIQNNVEVTLYKDPKDPNHWGSEIYFYQKNGLDIKYSRNYVHLLNLPKKYLETINTLKQLHENIFKTIIM